MSQWTLKIIQHRSDYSEVCYYSQTQHYRQDRWPVQSKVLGVKMKIPFRPPNDPRCLVNWHLGSRSTPYTATSGGTTVHMSCKK